MKSVCEFISAFETSYEDKQAHTTTITHKVAFIGKDTFRGEQDCGYTGKVLCDEDWDKLKGLKRGQKFVAVYNEKKGYCQIEDFKELVK